MRYMLLIYLDEQALGQTEQQECYVESAQFAQELHSSGHYLAAAPLHPVSTATSLLMHGRNVRITTGDLAGVEFVGRITAINSIVDEATRNIQVQATLANQDGKLRPGMFVQVEVMLGAGRSVVALPASAISYAPYGDSVFVVTDLKDANGQAYRGVRQQFVKLGAARGDQIAVVSGLKPGEEIVTSGVFKLRNGAAVLVNNKVQPANERAPKPEDS